MNNDLGAVLNGLQMGKTALSGLVPSGQSPRGAPPPVDPLTGRFRSVIAELNALAVGLSKVGDERRMTEVQEIGLKLQRMSIDRQDEINKRESMASPGGGNESYGANFPNINAGGIV